MLHKSSWFFVIFVIAFCLTVWLATLSINNEYRENHIKIIEAQEKAISQRKELLQSLQLILSDSTSSYDAKNVSEKLNELAANLHDQEVSHTTVSLLELEFSKLQNEYETLNLWCALLTVIFLIFSFYSFTKSNELTAKSEESLKNITNVEKDIKQKEEEITKTIKEKIDTQIQNSKEEFEKRLSDQKEILGLILLSAQEEEKKINNLANRTSALSSGLDNIIEEKKKEYTEEVTKTIEATSSRLEERFKTYISKYNERFRMIENFLSYRDAHILPDTEIPDDEQHEPENEETQLPHQPIRND